MKHLKILFFFAFSFLMSACGTMSRVPITGRKRHLLVSNEQILNLSLRQYNQYMSTAKISRNRAETEMVKRVGYRLANAVDAYLREHGEADQVKNFQWEFNLVDANAANAFCMPGGKVVVYTGLLPITRTETALAIVLGHEIAHAVAQHAAEQITKQMQAQYGAQALSLILLGKKQEVQDIAQLAFGLGAKGILLKYSRQDESEADYMGLIFAAMAGYDPREAVGFWERMAANNPSSMPAIFSDHPSDAKRIADIKKELPMAMKFYNASFSGNRSAEQMSRTRRRNPSFNPSENRVAGSELPPKGSKLNP